MASKNSNHFQLIIFNKKKGDGATAFFQTYLQNGNFREESKVFRTLKSYLPCGRGITCITNSRVKSLQNSKIIATSSQSGNLIHLMQSDQTL